MDNKRLYGIDVLRVIAAAMIVMLHVLSQGGILKVAGDFNFKSELLWLLQIVCYCGVNVFALISGYLGLSSKHRCSNIITLWLQLALYTVVSAILVQALFAEEFSVKAILLAFLPVTTSESWYFTAYFALFFFMPLLDVIIEKAERATLKKAFVAATLLFIVIETVQSVAAFGIRVGYSVLWLAFMYLVGAYIKKYAPFKNVSARKCGLGFIVCVLLTFMSRLAILFVTLKLNGEASHGTKFIAYTSPLMVLQAVFALEIFLKIKIPGVVAKIAERLSPMMFGVFIIHTTTFVYSHLLRDSLAIAADLSAIATLGVALLATIIIFAAGAVIDFLRIMLFKLIRVNKFASFLGNKFDSLFEKNKGDK